MASDLIVYGDIMLDETVYVSTGGAGGYCSETGVPKYEQKGDVSIAWGGAGNAAKLLHDISGRSVKLVSWKFGAFDFPISVVGASLSGCCRRRRYYDSLNTPLFRVDYNPPCRKFDYSCYEIAVLNNLRPSRSGKLQLPEGMLISDYRRGEVMLNKDSKDLLPKLIVANIRDVSNNSRWLHLPSSAFVVCNQRELMESYRYSTQDSSIRVPIQTQLGVVGKASGRTIIVTCGEFPVLIWDRHTEKITEVHVPRCMDYPQIIGAGDMFSAALLSSLASQYDPSCESSEVLFDAVQKAIAACLAYISVPRGSVVDEAAARSKHNQLTLAQFRIRDIKCAEFGFSPNKRLVLTNGCFDLLHPGHRHLLANCVANPGEQSLLVLVNSDESVSKLKGDDRPIRSIGSRLLDVAYAIPSNVSARVVAFDGDVSKFLLETDCRPSELVKGSEFTGQVLPGSSQCDSVRLIKMLSGYSTTAIVGQFTWDAITDPCLSERMVRKSSPRPC